MLDSLLVLCGILGIFMWWLVKSYDTGSDQEPAEQQKQQGPGRRRGRGRNKKGRDKLKNAGAKTAKTQQPPDADAGSADAATADLQRSMKRRGSGKQQLDAQEWPTLGADNRVLPQQQEEDEDLAALHAEMLKARRSAPLGGSDKGHGTSGAGRAAAGGGRSSGRIGVGDKVEARFEAGAEWFPAIVTKTLHGGLVNLLYDDGERETRVSLNLVRHRGAVAGAPSDNSDSSSDSESSEEESGVRELPAAVRDTSNKQADGWEVMAPKPKKTRVERIESRAEANSNLKNRLKRQKKREKEIAAREALRKKL